MPEITAIKRLIHSVNTGRREASQTCYKKRNTGAIKIDETEMLLELKQGVIISR